MGHENVVHKRSCNKNEYGIFIFFAHAAFLYLFIPLIFLVYVSGKHMCFHPNASNTDEAKEISRIMEKCCVSYQHMLKPNIIESNVTTDDDSSVQNKRISRMIERNIGMVFFTKIRWARFVLSHPSVTTKFHKIKGQCSGTKNSLYYPCILHVGILNTITKHPT